MNGEQLGRRVVALCVACLSGLSPGLARAQKPEVVAPTQIAAEPVPYPPDAHGAAEVVLELVIAQDGSVGEVQVREGREPFASAARRAVVTWQFTPATRDGIPIRSRITAKVTFREPVIVPAAPAEATPGAANATDAANAPNE